MHILQNLESLSADDELNELLRYDSRMNSCPDKNDSVYTYLQMRIGVKYYLLTDYLQAIQYLNKAIRTIKENENSRLVSKRYLVKFYYYLSIFYDSLKLVTQKNEAIDSCIAYEMKNDTMYHYSVFLLFNSVQDLYSRGDYNFCVEHASLGESVTRKSYHYSDRMDYLLFFIGYQANALWSLKKYDEAEKFLQVKKGEFLKSGNKGFLADISRLFGYVNKARNENQAAINNFLAAYRYDRLTPTPTITGEALTQVGLIYSEKFNNPRSALKYYHKALRAGNKTDAFYTYGYIANAYVKLKKFDSAYYFFQKAFNIIKPGFTERDLLTHTADYVTINSTEHVLNIVLDKADAHLDQYGYDKQVNNLYEALRIYKIADHLLNIIKENQFALESRLFWRSYAKRLYEHAIESSYLTGNTSEAFYFFEKSRAVLLNDQVNEQNLLSRDDLLMLAHLKSKIQITGRELEKTAPSSKLYAGIQNELFTYKQELIRFQERIKIQNPLYYQSSFDTTLISIREVQKKLLNGHGSFIGLYSGDSTLYTLIISAIDIHFLKTNRLAFDSVKIVFNSLVDNPVLLNSRFTVFANASESLFRMIFQNIPVPKGNVIISPDGQYFPFEALVTSKNGEAVTYFITDHAVSYTYSARFLFNDLYDNYSLAGNSFMGIAPVSYPAAFSLAALGGSDHSLATISGHFDDAVTMISATATRSNFLQQFYKYRIIQLYTHASDSSGNNEPVIYFADSALYLSDLSTANKPLTRLVVLSACETGSGKDYNGEGVFSFNRGFAALGIPSSVSNLWTVDNESTYKITELFYKFVTEGMSLDEALRNAKLEYLKTSSKEKQLPYYWASAVLIGNTGGIHLNKGTSWVTFAVPIAIPILFFILVLFLRKREYTNPIPGTMEIVS